jgi:hypothetical protein
VIRPEDIDALQAALDAEKGIRTALDYAMRRQTDYIDELVTVHEAAYCDLLAAARALVAKADAP